MVRIYFATDVHGSDQVWRKWANVPLVHGAEILILSGDLTGKSIVPIIKQKDNTYACSIFGRNWKLTSETEVHEMEEKIRFTGYYPYVCAPEDVLELQKNPKKLDQLFIDLMRARIKSWMEFIVEKVNTKEKTVLVMPGNDDELGIDDVIKSYEDRGIIYPLGKVINLCYDYEMISLDYVNPTPWNTPRECSEEELDKKVKAEVEKIKDHSKAIYNLHCPPYNTRLDLAPKLDKKLKPVYILGDPVFEHVGGKAIRKAEEEKQPMLGLHGHIHESFASDVIGKTVVLNPGSEYTEGILRGFIIDLSEKGVERYWKVEG